MTIQVPVPFIFKSFSQGNQTLYIRYIKGYLKSTHPNYKPVKILPNGSYTDYVMCEKIEVKKNG